MSIPHSEENVMSPSPLQQCLSVEHDRVKPAGNLDQDVSSEQEEPAL